MTGAPGSLADLPGTDVLSEVLRAIRLTGSVFLTGRFSAPFGVISPRRWDGDLPMARFRHISVFHLIAEGGGMLETAEGERRAISAGDLLLMPFTAEHRFWNGPHSGFMPAETLVQPGPIEGVSVIRHGGGGPEMRIVCGFLESSELLPTPVFRTLPHLIVENAGEDQLTSSLADMAREIVRQVDDAKPGAQLVLSRLMELLFVEILRRHAARLPQGSRGWLAALNDPMVSRALEMIHAAPQRRWTLEDLARRCGGSRTVLNERFNRLLGKPPIEYLAGWRIQLAAEKLGDTAESLARISEQVGYESEAAFSRAFKRAMGVSPGRWREQHA